MKYEQVVKDLRAAALKFPMQSPGSCYMTKEAIEKGLEGQELREELRMERGTVVGVCAVGAFVLAFTGDPYSKNSSLAKYGAAHPWIGDDIECPLCHKTEGIITVIRHHLNDGHGNHSMNCCSGIKSTEKTTPWTLNQIADWLATF